MSRYVIGIDLGTTNSRAGVCRRPTRSRTMSPARSSSLPIPQVVARQRRLGAAAPAVVFVFAGARRSSRRGRLICPGSRRRIACWASSRAITGPRFRAGWSARPRAGSRTPGSTAGAPILPWTAAEDVPRSRRSTRRRPISSTFATPGTRATPARRRPIGSRIRRSS